MGRTRRGRQPSRAGFALLEIMIAASVMLMALIGFSQVIISTTRMARTSRETAIASSAARRMLESLKGEDFSEVFVRHNSDPTDDPGGVGTAPGNLFTVAGLDLLPDDPDGFVGEILFSSPAGFPGQLRENLANPSMGMPRDLNADGIVDALDHSADHLLLPVLVRLEWHGHSGPGLLSFKTLLANR